MPAAHPEHLRATVSPPQLIGALALVWLICTLVNVTKAVHIDDTAHLAIAAHIQSDPAHPMSGTVFWGESPAPIHDLNQPHLFFYLLAGVLAVSGGSLFAAHLLVSLFTALTALFAYRLGRALDLSPRTAVFGASLLLLGPAFIPSQNLMTDVPVLAFWLAAMDALARADGDDDDRWYWIAALHVGLACLIKYTSLVLVAVLVVVALSRRRPRALISLIVPIAMLVAWSLFNVWDYGGVHILDRPVDSARVGGALATVGVVFGRAGLFVLTLGAVTPFTIGALPKTIARRGAARVVAIAVGFAVFGVVVGQGLAHFGPAEMRGEPVVLSFLRGVFVLNGLYAVALIREAIERLRDDGRERAAVLLGAWIVLTSLFVVVLSPFVAVRHLLLIVPAVIIALSTSGLVGRDVPALALTAAIGMAVAVGDYGTAGAYRDVSGSLAADERTYFVGHWGFQHYAEDAGLEPYVPGATALAPCDRLVRPTVVDQQPIDEADEARLTLIDESTVDADAADLFRTVTTRLGFYSVWHGVPYTLTLEPVETFEIYEVDSARCASSRAAATD